MGDPFENTDATERIMYYFTNNIPFPTAVFDGTNMIIGGEPETVDAYLSAYYSELLNSSPCTLNLLVEYDSTIRFLKVKSRVTAVDTFSNVHLRYAIAESHIPHHWTGLDSLHHVVRKMLPDHNGVAFSIDPGESFVDSQTYVLDSTWNDKNCYVVVFVQRDDSDTIRPVFRSARSGLFSISSPVSGDANGDGAVDAEDMVYLIKYLFIDGPAPHPLANGDPNSDCIVNVIDIVYLINYVFVGGPEPTEGCAW
jgi:hypothetical protein